jgi:ubiquinone/menaquinone biosynthesis C-methylase UbiE/ribosomal protein S18 acetylase RimI-like enzyme
MDQNIIKEIKEFDATKSDYISSKITTINKNLLIDYLNNLNNKKESNFKYIEAYNQEDNPIAGLCFQICIGPFPPIPTFFKCGSIWGFWGEKSSLEILILTAANALKKENVFKILTYSYNSTIYDILTNLNFCHSNALEYDLNNYKNNNEVLTQIDNIEIRYIGKQYDEEIYEHWKRMWEDNGIKTFKPNSKEMTLNFIINARIKYNYQTIGAFHNNKLIGSVCLNEFYGIEPVEKIGVIWAVYVHPEYRRRGIGTRLIEEIINHFKKNNFNSIRLIYASEEGKRIYMKKGFYKGNYLILDLNDINKAYKPFISNINITKDLLSICVPGQLKALKINNIESTYKGKIFNEKKDKMGKGFNMKNFNNKNSNNNCISISEKFDKLSNNWEDLITGMKYEYVFEWLAKQYKLINPDNTKIILDQCCGVGLQGQTLRLLGYKGKLIGCDISKGMLTKAYSKGIYNHLFIQDMNEELILYDNYIDIIINLGSMELLDINNVLKSNYRILKNNGILLVSFQWDNGTNPTEHQNIKGIKENESVELLEKEGFIVEDIVKCEDAFYTPKPNKEKSELIPVPYLLIKAIKK